MAISYSDSGYPEIDELADAILDRVNFTFTPFTSLIETISIVREALPYETPSFVNDLANLIHRRYAARRDAMKNSLAENADW